MRPFSKLGILLVLSMSCLLSAPAVATTFHFSTDTSETLQGNSLDESELWSFDTALTPGSEIFGPLAQTGDSLFVDSNENLEGFAVRAGIYYFTTQNNATLADTLVAIDSNDIVRYDPSAPAGSRASIYFDPDSVGTDTRINALSLHSDGDLLVSFRLNTTFDGLSVKDGDILKFDPASPTTTKSIYLDETATFLGDEDIDGFAFISATEMYLTTATTAGLPGLASFESNEIVLWDGTNGAMIVTAAEFVSTSGPFELDALSVPEPGTLSLLLAASALALRRRRL